MPLEIAAQRRIRAIMDELADVRQLPQHLLFTNRIPLVPADDDEIMARYTGRVVAADIIADDYKAVVRAPNSLRLESTKIPNLKHGEKVTQAQINVLRRIAAGGTDARDLRVFDNYLINRLSDLRDGVYARIEAIHVAMLLDALTYDRMGIKITAGWGMPSDLKVTVATVWSDTANATPVSDITAVQQVAQEKYGILLDRVTLTRTDFNEMTATAEFQAKSAAYSAQAAFPSGGFPVNDTVVMKAIAGRLMNAEVELYDAQTWTENVDGTQTAVRYLPVGKVLLTSSEGDNNPLFWDFANGVVTESVVADFVEMPLGDFGGPVEGPVAYATAPNADLNPPDITLWAVARGFSRKHKLGASAVLTV